MPSTVLSLGVCPQGTGGRSPNSGITRTQVKGEKDCRYTHRVAGGPVCQKSSGELATVQTSSRNTENNHILLIIAKENTLRLQLNYIKT